MDTTARSHIISRRSELLAEARRARDQIDLLDRKLGDADADAVAVTGLTLVYAAPGVATDRYASGLAKGAGAFFTGTIGHDCDASRAVGYARAAGRAVAAIQAVSDADAKFRLSVRLGAWVEEVIQVTIVRVPAGLETLAQPVVPGGWVAQDNSLAS